MGCEGGAERGVKIPLIMNGVEVRSVSFGLGFLVEMDETAYRILTIYMNWDSGTKKAP